jgi:hypothetical protein
MNVCLFAGCSYVSGYGWEKGSDDDRLWAKIVHSDPIFHDTQYVNVGVGGASNARIFYETTRALLKYPCEYAFVAWTSVPRYEFDLGLETYPSRLIFCYNNQIQDYNLNHGTISKSYLENIQNRLLSLVHNHREIVFLLGYLNILCDLADRLQTKIFFINSICPWDQDFFQKIQPTLPSDLTPYTQKLIGTETRDDPEIFEIYDIMHRDYNNQGGIQSHRWLNLYQSIRSLRVDTNSDDLHPGKQTNQTSAELFLSNLRSKVL